VTSTALSNALSVDVEEWFQVRNLEDSVSRESWDARDRRADDAVRRLLDLFERRGVRATFFVLGWIAERSPELVREIDRRGHEVAVHGYGHQSVPSLSPEAFEKDLDRALAALVPLVSRPVEGYRAPSFSLKEEHARYFEVLQRKGIRYDSSFFPGRKSAKTDTRPHCISRMDCGLVEVPVTSVRIGGILLPCGGGGFFRLFPYTMTRFLFRLHRKRGRPVIFYLHPWEIDPEQPRVPLPFSRAFRHRLNISRTFSRLDRLLQDFSFQPIREVLSEHGF